MAIQPQFCGNTSISDMIHTSLTYLSERDANIFRRKFREQREDERQSLHTFRELLVGVYCVRLGYDAVFEPEIDGQTPDWKFLGNGRLPDCLAEVVNFHPDQHTEGSQDRSLAARNAWCDWLPDNATRLYSSVQNKASKYKSLLADATLPYVIFVYTAFQACVLPHEVEAILLPDDGLFLSYPMLTGVCHFGEGGWLRNMHYRFQYHQNPHATHAGFTMSDGLLPIPLEPSTLGPA